MALGCRCKRIRHVAPQHSKRSVCSSRIKSKVVVWFNLYYFSDHGDQNVDSSSGWLGSEAAKHRMQVTDVLPGSTMPVNTLDIQDKTLICGTDSEQIYTVCNLVVR